MCARVTRRIPGYPGPRALPSSFPVRSFPASSGQCARILSSPQGISVFPTFHHEYVRFEFHFVDGLFIIFFLHHRLPNFRFLRCTMVSCVRNKLLPYFLSVRCRTVESRYVLGFLTKIRSIEIFRAKNLTRNKTRKTKNIGTRT